MPSKTNHWWSSASMAIRVSLSLVCFVACDKDNSDNIETATDDSAVDTENSTLDTSSDTEVDTRDTEVDTHDTEVDTQSETESLPDDKVEVNTPSGVVVGHVEGSSRAFKGIPYAAPPLGGNRWKKPSAREAWSTPFDATEFGPYCIQSDLLTGTVIGEEDCLTLNIWTPKNSSQDTPLPVMVWLHGGAFVYGSGSDPMYNGQALAGGGAAIVVTLNYRLGALGFLAHPELTAETPESSGSGNYALMDQRLALEWVQKNIAAFGGDPQKVTLFGQSAGAISVGMHLVSTGSWPLFHAAIVQSGPAEAFPVHTLAKAEERGQHFAELLQCEDIPCLRNKPAAELVQAYLATAQDPGGIFFQSEARDNRWSPTIDGDFLKQSPDYSIATGNVSKVPVILGTTLDEGPMFLSWLMDAVAIESHDDYYQALERVFGKNADAIVAAYPEEDFPSAHDALAKVNGDAFFVCPTRTMAKNLSANGIDTYLYSFEFEPEKGMLVDTMGVHHAIEIAYIFNMDSTLVTLGESDKELAETMGQAWTDFANTGSPNTDDTPLQWPGYKADTGTALVFNRPVSTRAGHRSEICDFWAELQY